MSPGLADRDPQRAFEDLHADAAAFGDLLNPSPDDVDLRDSLADVISLLGADYRSSMHVLPDIQLHSTSVMNQV